VNYGRIEPASEIGWRDRWQALEQARSPISLYRRWRSNTISSRDGQPAALADTRVFPPGAPSHGHADT